METESLTNADGEGYQRMTCQLGADQVASRLADSASTDKPGQTCTCNAKSFKNSSFQDFELYFV
jgi:hypothetical protein